MTTNRKITPFLEDNRSPDPLEIPFTTSEIGVSAEIGRIYFSFASARRIDTTDAETEVQLFRLYQ